MRRVAFGLAVCLLSCIVRGESTTVDGRTWKYSVNSNETATVTGVSPATGAITIPSTLGGRSVTRIGYFAFEDCRGLTSVTIPDGVTDIGGGAFWGCSGLTSVTIPDGVTYIGWSAFSGCSEFIRVVFAGDAPTAVGSGAFPSSATVYVQRDSTGWGVAIPGTWNGSQIRYAESGGDVWDWDPADDTPSGGMWLYPSTTAQTHGPHELNANDQYDFFRISMMAGIPYTFETTGNGDTYGELFASVDASYSVASNDDGGSGNNFKFSYTPTESGTYYLRVRAYFVGTSLSYTLVYNAAFPDGLDAGDNGTVSVDGLTWTYRVGYDGTATVTGVSPATGALAIPSTLCGRLVTGIDAWAFEGCDGLTSVTIPAGVTNIGWNAFSSCSAL